MIRINLLPAESIKKEERKEIFALALLVVSVMFLTGTVKYVLKQSAYHQLESKISRAESELTKYESLVRQVEMLQSTKSVLEAKKNVISSLMAWRLGYPIFMRQLLQLMPVNVWFASMSTQQRGDGMAVSLTAMAIDNYSIADFITALSANANFSNVELGTISSSGDKVQTSSFKLDFIYQRKQ